MGDFKLNVNKDTCQIHRTVANFTFLDSLHLTSTFSRELTENGLMTSLRCSMLIGVYYVTLIWELAANATVYPKIFTCELQPDFLTLRQIAMTYRYMLIII